MFDIDLGPLLMFGLVIFYVIPAVFGFLVGLIGVFLWLRKKGKTIRKSMISGIISGILLAVISPFIFISLNRLYESRVEKQHETNKKEFIARALTNYQVVSAAFSQNKYLVKFRVPRADSYYVFGAAYQNKQRVARLTIRKIQLQEGINEIEIPVEAINKEYAISVDFEIEVWSADENISFRNTQKKITVTNRNGIEVKEGAKYYSPAIAEWKDPCIILDNYIPCQPNSLLHIKR